MSAFQMLMKSPAFWTSLVSIVGLVALKYLAIPEDIWAGFAALVAVTVTILTGEGIAKATGVQIARSQREYIEQENEKLSLKGRG